MTVSYRELVTVTSDIEELLGYLKGNELVQEYWESQVLAAESWAMGGGSDALWSMNMPYESTPSRSEFVCTFHRLQLLVPFAPFGREGTADENRLITDIETGARQSWEAGVSWASGIGAYLRSIVEQITRPEPADFHTASVDLKAVHLAELVPTDFASSRNSDFGSTLVHWQGGTRDAFVTFYEHVPARVYMYASMVSRSADLVEMVGALVAATQVGLLDHLTRFRAALEEQLSQWVEMGSQPESFDHSGGLGWVGDVLKVANDIIGIIPVVDKFTEVPRDIATAAEGLGGLLAAGDIIGPYLTMGADDLPRRPQVFGKLLAAEVYTEMTDLLYDQYYSAFRDGLDLFDAEVSTPLIHAVEAVQEDGDWFTRSVPGASDTPWESDDN